MIMLIFAATLGLSTEAHAQSEATSRERFAFQLEIGAGTMLSSQQRTEYRYSSAGVQGTLRARASFARVLSVQLSTGYWWFASDRGSSYAVPFTLGSRLGIPLPHNSALAIDANFGIARTGDLWRLVLDTGVGFQFGIGDQFRLGPVFRYGQILHREQTNVDARYWSLALAAEYHIDEVERAEEPSEPAAIVSTAEEDTDRDGLIDPRDQCPREPETYNGREDADGCPEQEVGIGARIDGMAIVIDEQIHFDNDSAIIIGDDSVHVLDAVSALLRNHDEIRRVRIEGHTDDRADPQYNEDLSRRRAESVAGYLMAHGIDGERLNPIGLGERRPQCAEPTDACRAQNRRVEFHITERTNEGGAQ